MSIQKKLKTKTLSLVRRSQPLQGSVEVQLLLVIESVVEAKLCFQQIDLLIRAGAADNVAACELSKLPNKLTNRSRCGRDEDIVAFLRLAHIEECSPCSKASHTWKVGS